MSEQTNEQIQCPVCGYYCLGRGGVGCIDKPPLCGWSAGETPAPQEWTYTTQKDNRIAVLEAENTRLRATLINLIESHGAARVEVQIAALTQARAALKGDAEV